MTNDTLSARDRNQQHVRAGSILSAKSPRCVCLCVVCACCVLHVVCVVEPSNYVSSGRNQTTSTAGAAIPLFGPEIVCYSCFNDVSSNPDFQLNAYPEFTQDPRGGHSIISMQVKSQ